MIHEDLLPSVPAKAQRTACCPPCPLVRRAVCSASNITPAVNPRFDKNNSSVNTTIRESSDIIVCTSATGGNSQKLLSIHKYSLFLVVSKVIKCEG